jgi:hypothetical protein
MESKSLLNEVRALTKFITDSNVSASGRLIVIIPISIQTKFSLNKSSIQTSEEQH